MEFWNEFLSAMKAEREKECLEAGQVTLGELRLALELTDPAFLVKFKWPEGKKTEEMFLEEYKTLSESFSPDNIYPGNFHSYRGHYHFICVEPDSELTSVGDFFLEVDDAIGSVYIGYKGGEFYMDKNTPVWVDYYGKANGYGITDLEPDKENKTLWLVVDKIKDS